MENKMEKAIKKISKFLSKKNIKLNEPMKNHTTFEIGGPCDVMFEPTNKDEVIKTLKILKKHKIPVLILGRGSNMIVSDDGIRGAVVKLSDKYSKVTVRGNKLIAESGALLKDVSEIARDMELSGLEFACGIPGNIGGAVTMNAGAYNGEMKDVLESVTLLDKDYNEVVFTCQDMEFSYRRSIVQREKYIVLSATFNLMHKPIEEIAEVMVDLDNRRNEKQPLDMPSAGSIFKRPEGYYAGKLIQDSGLKGICYRGAMVSEKHSGFIVNRGGATANDVMTLIDIIKKTVYDKNGVILEREVKYIE